MKTCIALLFLCAAFTVGQEPDTLTTDSVIKMVQAGVPSQTIIRTIQSASRVDFRFLPYDLDVMARGKIPEDVFKAMAAKSAGKPVPGLPAPVPQEPPAPEAAPRRERAKRAPAPIRDDDTALRLGGIEPRFFVGANGGPNRSPADVASYSVGGEVAVGLLRNLEATGVYSFDHIGTFGDLSLNGSEFMGGAKIPFPNSGRVIPYLQGSLGGVHETAHAFGLSLGVTKFAFSVGGGFDVKIARHVGMGFDARAIKPEELTWQYRAVVGVFFRF